MKQANRKGFNLAVAIGCFTVLSLIWYLGNETEYNLKIQKNSKSHGELKENSAPLFNSSLAGNNPKSILQPNFGNNISYLPKNLDDFTFKVKKISHRLVTYSGVCLDTVNGEKSLVTYDPNLNESFKQILKVATGENVGRRVWHMYMINTSIPHTHTVLNAHAYFVMHSCEGNLHHFWADSFYGLYGLMKLNNEFINGRLSNNVYVIKDESSGKCPNRQQYEHFIYSLGVVKNALYKNISDKTCFTKAMFGYHQQGQQNLELERLVLRNVNVMPGKCDGYPRIVIIERYSRKILNSKALEQALKKSLLTSVKRVYFEEHPLDIQMQFAHCAKVLIGVLGAGLAHFRFMQQGGTFLEIGWKGWEGGRYNERSKVKGFNADLIPGCNARLNEQSWEQYYHRNPQQINTTRETILGNTARQEGDAIIWKYADCTVNITDAVTKSHRLFKSTPQTN